MGGFLYVALGDGDDRRIGALRSYTAGNWHLEVGGTAMGALKNVEGCGVEGTVTMATPTDKRPASSEYGPCKISFGTGFSLAGWQWINESLEGAVPRNAALIHVDSAGVADFQLTLANASIERFETPKLDASSNDVTTFWIDLAAQRIDKTKALTTPKAAASTAKNQLAANFRLTIPGLDTSKVSTIEQWAFSVPPQTAAEKAPKAHLENLTLLTSETAAKGFEDYLRASLINGETVAEKTAKLELLSSDLQSTVLAIDFTGVGIIGGELFGAGESSTSIVRRQFSFYVESATIKYIG